MTQIRDELNIAIPQCTSFDELSKMMEKTGFTLNIERREYGNKEKGKVYDRKNFLNIKTTDGKTIEQRYLGKAYTYDAVKKQLARNDDDQLKERILTTIKREIPTIQTMPELWAKLKLNGIDVTERKETLQEGIQKNHLTFTLTDNQNNKRELDSARFGHLNRNAIQRSIDEQNRDRDKQFLKTHIDQAIGRGLQPDQLAKYLHEKTQFDTRVSNRRVGERDKTILTFSRYGQVKPISNTHLEEQYTTDRIIERCQKANPQGYTQYLQRILDNKLEYPIQINDKGISTKTTLKNDLLELKQKSQTLPDFLRNIDRSGTYRWCFVDATDKQKPNFHTDLSGAKPIDGLAFAGVNDARFTSGISIDRELSYAALSKHFTDKEAQGRKQSVSAGGGDQRAKSSGAPAEQKPRILDTAAQVTASMEAQQDKIQADLDRQAQQISGQQRDASAMERRNVEEAKNLQHKPSEMKPGLKKVRIRKRIR